MREEQSHDDLPFSLNMCVHFHPQQTEDNTHQCKDKVHNFESEYLFFLHQNHAGVLENLRKGKLLDEDLDTLKRVALDLAGKYTK